SWHRDLPPDHRAVSRICGLKNCRSLHSPTGKGPQVGDRNSTHPGGAMPRGVRIALAIGTLLFPIATYAQTPQPAVINGTVKSEAQVIVPGPHVSVTALGLNQVANDLGQYKLTIPPAEVGHEVVIEVRAIGFASNTSRMIVRAGTQTHDIVMVTKA